MCAKNLKEEHFVYSQKDLQVLQKEIRYPSKTAKNVQQIMLSSLGLDTTKVEGNKESFKEKELSTLQENFQDPQQKERFCGKSCSAKWRMTQPEIRAKIFHQKTRKKNSSNKSSPWSILYACLEQGSPNARNFKAAVEKEAKGDWTQAENNWREWQTFDGSSDETLETVGARMDTGICNRIGKKAAELSNLLQSGPWESKEEISNRMRWNRASGKICNCSGQKEDRQTCGVRVESITIEKRTDPVAVFNLELEGTPHFFAEGILVHNCTTIKNPDSKRTKFLTSKLAPLFAYRRILSGLPTPRSPLDIYSQFEFLGPGLLGYKSYFSFRSRFAVTKPMQFGGRSVNVVVGYRDTDKLRDLIAPHIYRVALSDCYDLPPKVYMRRDVPLTEEQKRMYSEPKLFATSRIEGSSFVTATIVIAQIMRLHQLLCGHVVDEQGVFKEVPELRTNELLELLQDYDGKAMHMVFV